MQGVGVFSDDYPLWLCDVWGVVHNGGVPFPHALDSLRRHRKRGGRVIFVTNAPRPSSFVVRSLEALGVLPDVYDGVVSSGEVTRSLLGRYAGAPVFHVGALDFGTFFAEDGLSETKNLQEAGSVLCTGMMPFGRVPFEDVWKSVTFEDLSAHRPLLEEMASRALPMICANPDYVAEVQGQLVPCAGALALAYRRLGGEVFMAGKPYAPIYQRALEIAAPLFPAKKLQKSDILAIGDGLMTDVKGALEFGLSVVFIENGIHRHDCTEHLGRGGPLFTPSDEELFSHNPMQNIPTEISLFERLFPLDRQCATTQALFPLDRFRETMSPVPCEDPIDPIPMDGTGKPMRRKGGVVATLDHLFW